MFKLYDEFFCFQPTFANFYCIACDIIDDCYSCHVWSMASCCVSILYRQFLTVPVICRWWIFIMTLPDMPILVPFVLSLQQPLDIHHHFHLYTYWCIPSLPYVIMHIRMLCLVLLMLQATFQPRWIELNPLYMSSQIVHVWFGQGGTTTLIEEM